MPGRKITEMLFWLSILVDAFIIAALGTKASRTGISGLSAWFRHVHLVAVSATNGEATYQLQPDYRFTILYTALILGAFVASFVLLRSYLKRRGGAQRPGSGYHYDAPTTR